MRKKNIEVIVLTDGSRILGLGDLGVNGIGISIGKTSLYVAAGGIKPSRVLPVVLDVGTNNLELRNNPLYLGTRKPRCDDDTFYQLMDEFMKEASTTWPQAVIQFEDFSNNHCFDMLERYQTKYRCFNDDIQGTGSVVSAGYLSALKAAGTTDVTKTRIVFFGAGSAASGVAQSIVDVVSQAYGLSKEQIKKTVYMVDSKGLVAANRGDELAPHKVQWARDDVAAEDVQKLKTLEDVVKHVKPTALIGLGATGGVFTKEIIRFINSYSDHPIIFPLSNPSSKAEVNPQNAYKWTEGKAIIASGSPFPPTNVNGKECVPSQGNNLYIFPGVGLASVIAQPDYIPQEVLVAAAECLSSLPSASDREAGLLYPPITQVRKVSAEVAAACILKLQQMGMAKNQDLPDNLPDLTKLARRRMWQPEYPDESFYLNLQLQPNEDLQSDYSHGEEYTRRQ
ncbi:Malic enzyme, N-terminal domain/Malic enzyme, NAD binding domain containing protein, putative [Angomonas deanei]|uniref:Malic enzyme, N-terminal domain/Malic enzyme, NAD binding domain containing protein, putative n=1 Tax=Angomonas deanei TaxID=59799 RepID=A0A7G2CKH6_9TRYP|nr:Malic enzyme, N-terminal domain/Malic enzyme, NAD binding domain containing protein, putative [Angomonas deanei]